jgi:2-polyprenyl-3-methyl-5-hydroxy-6-metoxy-1,4-benzoquinol methylase
VTAQSDTNQRWDSWNAGGGPRYPHAKVVQFAFRCFPERSDRERSRALDLGCGTGVHTVFLAYEGFEVTAIDASSVAIDATRTKLVAAGLDAALEQTAIEKLDMPTARLDLVVCTGVLDSAGPATAAEAIPRVAEAMAPGGRGVFVFASDRDERILGENPLRLHGYSRQEVGEVFSGCFDEVLVDRYITTYGGGRSEHNDFLVTVRR